MSFGNKNILDKMNLNFKKIFLIVFVILGVVNYSSAQCGVSDFYSPDTLPFCAPDIAKFQVVNMPVGSTYEWDIGNGFAASNNFFLNLRSHKLFKHV